jgi:hypothetical protein
MTSPKIPQTSREVLCVGGPYHGEKHEVEWPPFTNVGGYVNREIRIERVTYFIESLYLLDGSHKACLRHPSLKQNVFLEALFGMVPMQTLEKPLDINSPEECARESQFLQGECVFKYKPDPLYLCSPFGGGKPKLGTGVGTSARLTMVDGVWGWWCGGRKLSPNSFDAIDFKHGEDLLEALQKTKIWTSVSKIEFWHSC